MAKQLYANNASTVLASLAEAADTVLTVGDGYATWVSPSGGDFQMLTLSDGVNVEIVKLTGRSTSAFTVARAQEGTSARAWPAGTNVAARITAGMLNKLMQNQTDAFDATATGEGATADTYGTAFGKGATAGASGTAVGRNTISAGSNSAALGLNAIASGEYSAAIGMNAEAAAKSSFAGPSANAYTEAAWVFVGHPAIPRDNWSHGAEKTWLTTGAEGSFATAFVDLGNIPPWQAATTYTDGDVVRPTVDNGKQYHLWHGDYSATSIPNTTTSGAIEPAWELTDGWQAGVGDAAGSEWICLDVLSGLLYNLPPNTLFFPTEFGFICFKHANVTAAPYVSVGTAASPNLYVNNQQLTGITGALQIQRLTPLVNTAVTELQFKLNTKATGTNSQFHGRFYAKGLFIQAQG